jgi:hypothetical protein
MERGEEMNVFRNEQIEKCRDIMKHNPVQLIRVDLVSAHLTISRAKARKLIQHCEENN